MESQFSKRQWGARSGSPRLANGLRVYQSRKQAEQIFWLSFTHRVMLVPLYCRTCTSPSVVFTHTVYRSASGVIGADDLHDSGMEVPCDSFALKEPVSQ